jgi:hypothetical protein
MAGGGLAAYGMFFVTSNIVHVDMQYTVDLTISGQNNVRLTASVTQNGNPVRGIDVAFYYSFNGGDWIYFATSTTNGGGFARASYRITGNGVYDFKAMVSSG